MENKFSNKKIKFLLISFFAFMIPFRVFSFEKPIIEDCADLLTVQQENLLLKEMEPITNYGEVVFYTNSSSYDGEASDLAKSIGTKYFEGKSGTVFLIDMYNRRIEIFSDGYIYTVVGKTWANGITDNIYSYATNEDYYTCAKLCFNQIQTLLDGGKISVPMRHLSNGLLAIALSLLIFFIVLRFSRTKKIYGNSKDLVMDKKTEEELSIPLSQRNKEKKSEKIEVLEKKLKKEDKILRSSSSGSRGGGGGRSGGGSSSGGGGHGF